MNFEKKLLNIINAKTREEILSKIVDIFYLLKVDDFLIVHKHEDKIYLFNTNYEKEINNKNNTFQWERYAIKQEENIWYIDNLIYDFIFDNNILLAKNKDYYVYTSYNNELILFAHFRVKEFSKDIHKKMLNFTALLKHLFNSILFDRGNILQHSLNKRIEELKKQTDTLQKLSGLLQSTFELNKILNIISQYIGESLGFKVVLFSLYDKQNECFVRSAQYGLDKRIFEKLKKQTVPLSKIKHLLIDKHRISKSYYISHNEREDMEDIEQIAYVLPDEKASDYTYWHPEDILLIPLYSKNNDILGIISLDKPVDKNVKIREAIDILESFAQTAALAIENSRLFNNMNKLINDLKRVNELSSQLTSFLELQPLLDFLVKEIRIKFNYYNVTVWLFNQEGLLEVKAFAGYNENYLEDVKYAVSSGQGIIGWVAENVHSVLCTDTTQDLRYIGRQDVPFSEIAIPLKVSNHVIGVLNVEREGKFSLDGNDLVIISIIASHLSTAIDNTFKYEETEKLSITDDMTGIYNYRYFMNRLKDEIIRSKKMDIPLSLIMIDIDYFKDINDTKGHITGDKVIQELANLLRKSVRKGDIVTRYGGDEFFIILPGSSKKFTQILAKRIKDKINEHNFIDNIKITVSIGIVTYPTDASNLDALLKWVDNALYSAKNKGRNRVEGG